MRKELRSKTVGCKMTENEHAKLQSLAERKGQALSDWCREALLFHANQNEERTSEVESIVLEEVLALRTVLTTILFHISHGHPVKEGDMRALLEKADESKQRRAGELRAQFQKRMEANQ